MCQTTKVVQDLSGSWIPHQGIDREVSTCGGLSRCQSRIEDDLKSLVARRDFRVTARNGEIEFPTAGLDRMLQQLKLSGMLRGCKAVAFGECVKCPDDAGGGGRSLDEVLGEIVRELKVPCVTGIPVGHISEQWTIPLGAMATLDADSCTLSVASYAG